MTQEIKLPLELMPSAQSALTGPAFRMNGPQDFEPEKPSIPISHYIWILRRHIWKMIAFVAACVLCTFVVSSRLQPIYESTATIVIDRQQPSEVVGREADHPEGTPGDSDQFMSTQLKLVLSDAVLRPVVNQFHLLNIEGRLKGVSAERAELITDAPVTLKRLKVVRPPNTYLILISYRSPDPGLSASVANAIADSYLKHTYNLRIRSSSDLASFMEKQLDELKATMERSSTALAQYEKALSVVNPEEKTNILSARLLQLNNDYTTAQSDRMRAEALWNSMQSGSLEAAQVSGQGDTLSKLTDQINQTQQQFAQIKATYGPTHPEYKKVASELAELQKQLDDARRNITNRIEVQYKESISREQMLGKAVADAKAEWDQINERSFEYQRLKQEADTDKALYDELIKKIREADINAGFENNNIRIADSARPEVLPVFPNLRLNILLALMVSLLLATGAALLQDSLDTTLRDPEEARRYLGVDVIGLLPMDRNAADLPKATLEAPAEGAIAAVEVASDANGNRARGYYSSVSRFEESVRTIRNTILLADFEQRLRSICVTSATPSEGKTTIAAHLAVANAARGKKTLLVDGDLRRPSLHAKFGVNPRVGLSNVLTGELAWQEVIIPIEGRPGLYLLPSGPGSHRAADLIGPRLSDLLNEFSKDFDLVILDSPPLLGFAECLQIASAADGVLIISRAGETKRRAVATVVTTLRRLRANVIGVVLNQAKANSADGYPYYGYGYYQYGYYSQQRKPEKQPN